jgi:polyisoprenyl-phosphate glycosyltransferase
MKKKISIVMPFYNEEKNLLKIFNDLRIKVIDANQQNYNFEVLLMNNNSTDNSSNIAKEIINKFSYVKYYKMSRNFGYQANIKAGYDLCTGDAAVQLDTDGEDDPELINSFIKKWELGYDVVYGLRIKRKENKILSSARNMFYFFLRKYATFDIPEKAGDFRLLDRKVINHLKKFDEKNLYLRGLISYVGFNQTGINYERKERLLGNSKFSLLDYFSLSLNAIASYTKKPLLLIFYLGTIFSLINFILIPLYLLLFLFGFIETKGFTTLILIVLFFFGFLTLLIGILGVYIGYILDEVKNRPIYIIDENEKKNT